jgi:hypothetical protein
MVRGEYERVPSQNGHNGRMSLELLVKELPDPLPAPAFWMIETCIKGKISFIEGFCFHLSGLGSTDRHVEYSEIQEIDAVMVFHHKLNGLLRFGQAFVRSSEKKIDVSGYPYLFQVP